jgi:hypothetical protein
VKKTPVALVLAGAMLAGPALVEPAVAAAKRPGGGAGAEPGDEDRA